MTCRCTLKHSAVAGLDDDDQIDVHTTDNDAIPVSITGLGQDEAVFNEAYGLIRANEDPEAVYYMQPLPVAMVMWVYFKRSHAITYAKLRAFPGTG